MIEFIGSHHNTLVVPVLIAGNFLAAWLLIREAKKMIDDIRR